VQPGSSMSDNLDELAASGGREMNPVVVTITGCSTRIGRRTASALAAAGREVVATARMPEELITASASPGHYH
jgi:NAD(P)-dependent dehydrogenase (short-subunit alcohol dehydrogenase family)